ncbi:hypothetical protein C8Q78DRAFT_690404 [Trametes maxima]|nr:hypothetical protein C8Q78DRAFT_690404 [Trametes maxima]
MTHCDLMSQMALPPTKCTRPSGARPVSARRDGHETRSGGKVRAETNPSPSVTVGSQVGVITDNCGPSVCTHPCLSTNIPTKTGYSVNNTYARRTLRIAQM